MKENKNKVVVSLIAIVAFMVGAYGGDQKANDTALKNPHESVPVRTASADSEAATLAAYPMTVCVVSGDQLESGGMEPYDYFYKEEGKPEQLVRLCCKDCLRDFKKDPEKYLEIIEAAAVKRQTEIESDKSTHLDHSH